MIPLMETGGHGVNGLGAVQTVAYPEPESLITQFQNIREETAQEVTKVYI